MNKIDRENNSEATILGEVYKVLGPHQGIPIYPCAASKYLRASGAGENRQRFIQQSRMRELVDGLDGFVADAGIAGRLTTPLTIVSDLLDSLQARLAASDDDRKRLELLRRKSAVLERLQRKLVDVRKTWKQQAYSTVMSQTDEAVEQISDTTTGEDLDSLFTTAMSQVIAPINQVYDDLEADLRDAIALANSELEDLGQTPLAQDVARIEAEHAERLGIDHKNSGPNQGTEYVLRFFKATGKPLQEGLQFAADNAAELRNIIYEVGKTLGKKFRPWEAVKMGQGAAKVAGKLGKAIPFLAAGLDLFFQYREEKAKEEKARYLANLRLTLRNAFADQAKVEADTLEAVVLKVSRGPLQEAQEELDREAERITAGGDARSRAQSEIGALKRRCSTLRDEIYSGLRTSVGVEGGLEASTPRTPSIQP
ncbi:LeoA/HP0731 family dynamin-like GTPase [Skermanella pratensis]|uniref:LeoA/HP0731 family dynamin-like GTPase n=1 Tax=Skermanella pratensis TaxID=2233999 RepID=UPI001787B5AC|nr:LeoA/HP0731 family dynamin-like GTPase [Skermanella pratensis]